MSDTQFKPTFGNLHIQFSLWLLALLSLASFWFGAWAISERFNSLALYPVWQSKKAELALGVMGSQSFLVSPYSLRTKKLNLGAWHGYQELRYEKWLHFSEVDFSVSLKLDGHVVAFFENQKGEKPLAIRLSRDPNFPSAFLSVAADGHFLSKETIDFIPPEEFNVSIRYKDGLVSVSVNQSDIGRKKWQMAEKIRLGFRGSESDPTLVSNLKINTSMGHENLYFDRFHGRNIFWATVCWAILFMFFLKIGFLGGNGRLSVASFSLTIILISCLYIFYFSKQYSTVLDLTGKPNHIERPETVLSRLQKLPSIPEGIFLFLGGSQTWGAGSSKADFSWVAKFSAKNRSLPYHFVNGAYSGAKVTDLKIPLQIVQKKGPVKILFLIVGHNDYGNARFREQLEELLALVDTKVTSIWLLQEPVSPENIKAMKEAYGVVSLVAQKTGAHYFDASRALEYKVDEGFLWWDRIHLTDFGQSLMAEFVHDFFSRNYGVK